ncbi:MAG TPA: hypothetical protein VMH40_07930 [Myxococcaceae bacterium]|nr:hypothetical protein [Myxococcaceae bacterium]
MSPRRETARPGRNTTSSAGSAEQMETFDNRAAQLRRALLLGVLVAACGARSPDPGVVQGPGDGGTNPSGPSFERAPGWSLHRRMRSSDGRDVLFEEQLATFLVLVPGPSRIRRVDVDGIVPWDAPEGLWIEDAALHPSGAVTAVLADDHFNVWLARLAPDLSLLQLAQLQDPDIVHDPFPDGGTGTPAPTTLTANPLPRDAIRVAADGEEAVVVVTTGFESVLLYHLGFSTRWETPRRTLVVPVNLHLPFLPTGGSFDTFGAMWSSFRALLDVDQDGNVYVAYWANHHTLQALSAFTGEELHPIATNAFSQDSDVLLEKLDRTGTHLWSRVIGTENEDEPYAVRATVDAVAVVGRSRRFPGFDNTFWDAFVSISAADGTLGSSRALQLEASSILLAVDGLPDGGWLAGGSEGWSQNPDGLSVLTFGTKLLLALPTPDADPVRLALPAGPRHNEVRTVVGGRDQVWFGGHEDGPVMHTGDGDLSQIHATGVLGFLPR